MQIIKFHNVIIKMKETNKKLCKQILHQNGLLCMVAKSMTTNQGQNELHFLKEDMKS